MISCGFEAVTAISVYGPKAPSSAALETVRLLAEFLQVDRQQQQPKPALAPFLKPLFVEPTGGAVCPTWDPIKAGRRSLAGHSRPLISSDKTRSLSIDSNHRQHTTQAVIVCLLQECVKGEVARSGRFELPTPRFVVWCSIQLSYERFVRRGASGLAEGWRTIGEAPSAGKCFRQHLFPAASGADGACVRRVSG